MKIFTRILKATFPPSLTVDLTTGRNPAFSIVFEADGEVPFPQVILRERGSEHLFRDERIRREGTTYTAEIPAGLFGPGDLDLQIEGCRKSDLSRAGAEDWIKTFGRIAILHPPTEKAMPSSPRIEVSSSQTKTPPPAGHKVYFAIHKHMHQPYYHSVDRSYWDGEKEQIFASRQGPYTRFLPAMVRQYIQSGLPHAGCSTSWSGSLIEQLNRCEAENLCGGCFRHWSRELREIAQSKTVLGHPRLDFTAFGFYHPLMPLIPPRDICRQIERHREIIRKTFDTDVAPILFPPETAFHVRMIPALREAGIEAVIYDSIHRYRTCRDYPYAGPKEGMLPPNRSEQVNPPASDWFQLHNIWAGSLIAPSLLKPEYAVYEDPEGKQYTIIAIPAERYIGNEDARGGFGALQYPDVLGQVYDQLERHNAFDPAHPPFFVLHSDGDNHGGGAECYYTHNTGQLVEWLKRDPRFELTTIRDYLARFPPDPTQKVHIEPGAWSGADNGDPQFMKWFSRYHEPYSPDLHSWAVLTAFQNAVHTLEDAQPTAACLPELLRLLLTAETSCYWYWTGQEIWDAQVTNAANFGWGLAKGEIDALLAAGKDRTGPTIFPPWVLPENPGGLTWGQGGLRPAPREATVRTFISDISGLKRVTLHLRTEKGEMTLPMTHHGPYPSRLGAAHIADYFTADLPVGLGDVRYFIEAEDTRGNISRGSLERIFLA